MSTPVKIFAREGNVDDNTKQQAQDTAKMPFIHHHVALMPDAHFGRGSSVGTVIATKGAVIPAAVGVDIGCGMIAVRTRFNAQDIRNARDYHDPSSMVPLGDLRESIESAIPLSPGNYNAKTNRFPFTRKRIDALYDWAQREKLDLSHSPKWPEQLGSLGGGNHFIEVCLDQNDDVWLFLHSGSRGVGNKIAQKHIKVAEKYCKDRSEHLLDMAVEPSRYRLPNRDLAFLEEGTPEFDAYIKDLAWAQAFAYENRMEMMDRLVQAFAHWVGVEPQRVELERINTHHNYTQKEVHYGEQIWLTRKGAVDAHEGVRGLIPGSMGTRSYVTTGKGNEEAFASAPHGAGRRFSRTEAKRRYTEADLEEAMKGIEYRRGPQWIDEIPGAYKPIEDVMEDAKDLVEITHTLRQILNVKGT